MDVENKVKKTDNMDWEFIAITIMSMIVAIILFENSKYGYKLDMKDYFQFISSIGGAILGAIVSFKILNITIKEQKRDMKKIEARDEKRWEETVKQFNIQIKIQGYNDKISDVNSIYKNIIELHDLVEKQYRLVDAYENGLEMFVNKVDVFRAAKIRNTGDIFNVKLDKHISIDEIGENFRKIILLINNIENVLYCIDVIEVTDEINELINRYNECLDLHKALGDNYQSYEYCFMYEDNDEYKKMKNNILQTQEITFKYKLKIYDLIPLSSGVIAKINNYKKNLYKSKYKLSGI